MNNICRCERCGRFRELFQYTHFEVPKIVEQVKDNGHGAKPRFTTERVDLAQSRGLCEECAVVVNSRAYDEKTTPNTTRI